MSVAGLISDSGAGGLDADDQRGLAACAAGQCERFGALDLPERAAALRDAGAHARDDAAAPVGSRATAPRAALTT